jgi:transcriptional regulator NrdR family protein
MKCPICSTWAIRLETRSNAMYNTVRRRYECGYLHRFSTVERVVSSGLSTRRKPAQSLEPKIRIRSPKGSKPGSP